MQTLQRSQALMMVGLFLLFLMIPGARGQEGAAVGQGADALFEAQEWAQAVEAYRALLQQEPANGTAWFRLGVSLHSLKEYAQAIEAYQQAQAHGYPLLALPLRVAFAHLRLGHNQEALQWLEKALKAGLSPAVLKNLPLGELRQEPAYQQLEARYGEPCGAPEYRVFDFWVGEWEVTTAQGQPAGTNLIEKILNGCVLLENWTGVSGGSGKSFNFYDAGKGRWTQTWVADSGNVLEVHGGFRDGAMRFDGQVNRKDGTPFLDRMTFFPLEPGKVRQLIEHSGDNGKTWVVWFDGIYNRKNGEE